MKIVFMGTAPFAIPCLHALADSKDMDVSLVVTQPDKAVGRGHKLRYTAFKQSVVDLGLPLFQPDCVKNDEAIERIKALKPDFLVVVAYGQILNQKVLDLPNIACINVHGSLLPKYRGAAPIHWAVINGEAETGVCTMHMARKLDAGDVIYCDTTEIEKDETTGALYDRLQQMGAGLLVKTLRDLESGIAPRTPQIESESTYAPMIFKQHRYLDWNLSGRNIADKIRGLYPTPRAITRYQDEDYIICEARFHTEEPIGKVDAAIRGNGLIAGISPKHGLFVCCRDGWLELLRIKAPGKKEMDAKAYLNGAKLQLKGQFESEEKL
jgi:methionyl-tRNA formyltransferase